MAALDASTLLDALVSRFEQALGTDLVAIVLFGSRARGEAHAESDWDLLVVADHLPQRHLERHIKLKRIVPSGLRAQSSLWALTPEEFDAPRYLPSLYFDLALDGRVLFDRDGYMGYRLAKLNEYMSNAGLERRREPWGDMWSRRRELHAAEGDLPWRSSVHADG